jgi:hypothetical protein
MTLSERVRERGVVDTHYHVGPELLPRRYDVASLAEAALAHNTTVVLKNHTYPTTPLAALGRARYGASLIGGVVLNRFVGGINVDAVRGALSGNRARVGEETADPSPVVVWMPTVHAASHLRAMGSAFDPRWGGCCGHPALSSEAEAAVEVFDGRGEPTPGLRPVLEEMARNGCRLATGHLSADEVMRLVPLALEIGVPSVIVTHPHYPSVGLSAEQMISLSGDSRVFLEHCFAIHTIEQVPIEEFVEAIRATGPDQVILATDFGQVHSAPLGDGTLAFAERLAPAIGEDDLVRMLCDNGRRALGLVAR